MSSPDSRKRNEVVTDEPDLTDQLRRVVDALDRGDLTAGPLARAYLTGALDGIGQSNLITRTEGPQP